MGTQHLPPQLLNYAGKDRKGPERAEKKEEEEREKERREALEGTGEGGGVVRAVKRGQEVGGAVWMKAL